MIDVAPSIALLSLSCIHESPTNPRRTYDPAALAELAESIREKGILQPILVRPLDRGYEVVFGHRRLRAATAAGLSLVPAMVSSLDDRQVLEAQILENSQRADVSPLEEADGYKRLHETYGITVEEIATRVGKSPSFVYGRLRLCDLGEAGREALAAGRMLASVALLVARLSPEAQDAAMKLIDDDPDGEPVPLTLAQARRTIESCVMMRLAGAPFDAADKKLVKGRPACGACPSRSGAQASLLGETERDDYCMAPACFKLKVAAAQAKRIAAHKKRGGLVLEGEAAKAATKYGSDYLHLDDNSYEGKAFSTYRTHLGAELPPEQVVIAVDPADGEAVEMVSREFVQAWRDRRRAELGAELDADPEVEKRRRERKQEEVARSRRDRAAEIAIEQLVDFAQEDADRALVAIARQMLHEHPVDSVVERREFDDREALSKALPNMTQPELLGLLVEILAPASGGWMQYPPRLVEMCADLDVDLTEIEASLGDDADEYADVVPEDEEAES